MLIPQLFTTGNDDHLLRTIRWVAGVSILLILLLTTIAVFEITSDEMVRDAKELSVSVTRSMFEQKRDVMTRIGKNGETELYFDNVNFKKFDTFCRMYLRYFDILKIKIYSLNQEIIYSTDPTIIGKVNSDNNRLKGALSGKIDTHVENKDTMLDLANETKFKVSVVETYVPIKFGDKVIGVFETYTNVTDYKSQILDIVTKTIASLIIILLIVFYCSSLVIIKVTALLKKTQNELSEKVIQLEDALNNVKQLEGIIPICAYCKKIRDDEKSWHQLEQYISEHSQATFSHGICPDCYNKTIMIINEMPVRSE